MSSYTLNTFSKTIDVQRSNHQILLTHWVKLSLFIVPWMVIHPTLSEIDSSNCALNNCSSCIAKISKEFLFFCGWSWWGNIYVTDFPTYH
jgi:hypothetical protein